jgi:hypothetical protein
MTEPHHAERLLAKVLGPEGPELTCEQCFEELDRYAELEIAHRSGDEHTSADEAIPGMRAHLEGCPACAEDHASLLAYLSEQDRH